MARFFVDYIVKDNPVLKDEDATHILKSLRMKVDDEITICDRNSTDHICVIESIKENKIFLKVKESNPCLNEPSIYVTLYQSLPKFDKMDLIVQKAVELGVSEIVPVLTKRCISRPDEKSIGKKILRWQKISKEASKQSRRGRIPKIGDVICLESAVKESNKSQVSMVFYELMGKKIGDIIKDTPKTISIFVGPEGGFDKDEILKMSSYNIKSATLGRRILRTETAPIAALSIIMYETGNMQ